MTREKTTIWSDPTGFMPRLQPMDIGVARTSLVVGHFETVRFHQTLFKQFQVEFPLGLSSAVPKRRAEFLAGRLAARYAFCQLSVPDQPIPQQADRAPSWPPGIIGSISHTGDLCAAVISVGERCAAGIDIEKVATGETADAIHDTALISSERSLVKHAQGLTINQCATLIFSAKESFFKALHPDVGRFFGFDSAELVELPSREHLYLRLTTDLSPNLPAGSEFELNYRCCDGNILTWLVTSKLTR